MAFTTVNSGKKIQFCDETLTLMQEMMKKTTAVTEEIHGMTGSVRMASVDRVYNVVCSMANDNMVVCGEVAKTIQEFLDEMAKRTQAGEALVQAAKKLIPVADSVLAAKKEFEAVPQDVIDGRGLDENYTPASAAALDDQLSAFIDIRLKMINEFADMVANKSDEDTAELYVQYGKALETYTNNQAVLFNKLKEALTASDLGLSKSIEATKDNAGAMGAKLNVSNVKMDISGAEADI